MVSLGSLWLPILLSAVLVHLAGFVMHTILNHHWNDYARLPDEAGFLDALRRFGIGIGQYHFPKPASRAELKDPAFLEKARTSPNGLLHIVEPMPAGFGKQLGLHFAFCVAISIVAAYLTGAVLPAGSAYLAVFRVAGTAALLGYDGALFLNAIWFGWSWGSTWRHAFDGLVYALLTAGSFGWLWPGA